MPLYEYICEKCGVELEKIQGMNGIPPLCPKCGVAMSRKLGNIAMYVIEGLGYNSRRKFVKGTAPYTRATKEWTPDNRVPFK